MTNRSPVPAEFTDQDQAWGTATERQLAYIGDLMAKKIDPETEVGKKFCARYGELAREGELSKYKASEIIDWLKDRPNVAPVAAPGAAPRQSNYPNVPAGRYALREADGVVRFYKVDRPTEGRWAGFTFLAIQASDDLHPIRDKARKREVLSAIEADPAAASKLYGVELGSCGVCGRTLTDETSREYGIGPVCRERTGW